MNINIRSLTSFLQFVSTECLIACVTEYNIKKMLLYKERYGTVMHLNFISGNLYCRCGERNCRGRRHDDARKIMEVDESAFRKRKYNRR